MPSAANLEVLKHLFKESESLIKEESEIWARQPEHLDTFIRDHLKLGPLSERQRHDILTFLGEDPEKVFASGSPYNVCCMLFGKGSGKDYMASIVITYLFYVMLCMKSPQKFFGFSEGTPLDILLVSYTGKQAKRIGFQQIRERFTHWYWLRNNYTLVLGEKYLSNKGKRQIRITEDMITSDNNIRIMSEHSQSEGFEGYNPIAWVLSEASAFNEHAKERNANKIYDTLKSSSSTRYPAKQWKGMIISFPRFDKDTDFTYLLWKEASEKSIDESTGCSVYATKGATWEVRPWKVGRQTFYSGEFFDFRGFQVPIEHKEEFENRPEESMRMLLCEPQDGAVQTIPDEVIIKSVHSQPPLITSEQYEEDGMIRLRLKGLENKDRFIHQYLLTIDLGEVTAATAMVLQHIDASVGWIMDAVWTWTPDQKRKLAVDFIDVKKRINEVAKAIPHIKIGFDQWQSIPFRADLKAMGVKTIEYHTYKERDYGIFKKGMAAGVVRILNPGLYCPEFVTQLKALKDIDGVTVLDGRISKRKDIVDAAVGGFMALMKDQTSTNLPGYIIRTNLGEFGTMIIEEER